MVHRVVILALPGVVTFDLGCALQVFAHTPAAGGGPGLYEVTVAAAGRRVMTNEGLALGAVGGLGELQDADTIVVPGYGTRLGETPSRAAVVALVAAADRGARVMSICVGAFALAHAGLLDGRRATTHWAAAGVLAERFPRVQVVPDVLYVDTGQVLTSAGLAAGLDLALHVVRRDHGAAAAAAIARWNVMAPHRDGGQAQYVPRPVLPAAGTGLEATRAWALAHLHRPLRLAELAAHAHCSQRTFTRRFRAETGSSPQRWLTRMRLERARELLESTPLPVEQVATAVGFPTAAALRAHFATNLHTTPTAYRRAFGTR